MVATALIQLLALLSTADSLAVRADTARAPVPRVVRTLDEIVVRSRLRDPLSSQSIRSVSREAFTRLPLDRASDAVALQPGVVGRAGELHVRGGRGGDLRVMLAGIPLEEAVRDRAIELPALAIESADLVSGGLDARAGGGLSGVLEYRTLDPPARPGGALQWQTSGAVTGRFDRIGARAGAPLGHSGLGAVASAEVALDDMGLPDLRTDNRRSVLGIPMGWRAGNRTLGHLKLTAGHVPRHAGLEIAASREVSRPFDPMWSLDGWTTLDVTPGLPRGPGFSPTELPGYERYRAADHKTITDDRRLVAILSADRVAGERRLSAAAGWSHARSITSLDGRDDERYATDGPFVVFGRANSAFSDPFYAYWGDEPFFQRRTSDSWFARADYEHIAPRGTRFAAGAGGRYDAVRLHELDSSVRGFGLDTLRSYEAYAPGGYAYGQLRWVFEGLVANLGLRGEAFTAGPQAERQSFPSAGHTQFSLSPRAGVTYPISVRSVFTASYIRLQQDPARDFLYDNRTYVTNRQPIGNPALVPATVVAYQAALRHELSEHWSTQATYFFDDLFGAIATRDASPGLGLATPLYRNADEGHSSGVEFSLLNDTPGARAEWTYTFLEAYGTISREEGVPYGDRLAPRPSSIGEHPLDWDRRHSLRMVLQLTRGTRWSLGWITEVGSPFPWTPRDRRQLDADVSRENSRRLGWDENTSFSLRYFPPRFSGRVTIGLEAHNLFDSRSDATATANGYPNPTINTTYDDYAAYRTETGRGGGAYWDDPNGDGNPQWVPVHDPRLFARPRSVRMVAGLSW